MEDKKPFDPVAELATLSKLIKLKEFYSINIWNFGEIRLQGKFNSSTRDAAKSLGIQLEFNNEDGMIRGNDGFIYLVLTE
jgi:hypothetical protein